jgi:hypothetical protein
MTILLWQRILLPDINGTMEYYLNKPVLEDMQEESNGILTFPFTIEINLQPVYQPCKQQLKCVKSYWHTKEIFTKMLKQ